MNVIITGASGLVATELILNLLNFSSPTRLTLVSRNPKDLIKRYSDYTTKVECITLDELIEKNCEQYDTCIHTAFARSSEGEKIAESLEYTERLCKWAANKGIKRFINISSQSVYGNSYEPYINEYAKCAPSYMYALGKYSSELLAKNIFYGTVTRLVNIRLSSVCENARFLKVFVENAIKGYPIEVVAPNQMVSFIDVRDVANALINVIFYPSSISGDFNLGSGKAYSIIDVSQIVKRIGEMSYNIPFVDINVMDNGASAKIGMSIDKFCNTFRWTPKFDISRMIESLFEMLTNVNSGGVSAIL